MDTTPTMNAILDVLSHGPATSEDLKDRTRTRRRSNIDKATTDLAASGLITQSTGDDGVSRWCLPDPDLAIEPDQGQAAGQDLVTQAETSDGTEDEQSGEPDTAKEGQEQPESVSGENGDEQHGDAEQEAKNCRHCRNEMPKVCPSCQQKTPVLCGTCRIQAKAGRRSNPGEPEILSNGLPKLRPGQMTAMVLDIMRTNPLPEFVGILGWTPGRIAVHLPGRSLAAIALSLDKLTDAGQVKVLGDEKPMRYALSTESTESTESDPSNSGSLDTEASPDVSTDGEQLTHDESTAADR